MAETVTIGGYLVQRLEQLGLKHVFGIPGDYVLSFYDLLAASSMRLVGTCTEIGAGYAADAYARVNGLGAVCITYCVGGLNVLNAVAGAYAEKSPLVVISGSPGLRERTHSPLLHHRVRNFDTQERIYRHVTVAAAVLDDPAAAPSQIDEVLEACVWNKRPVYLEIPRDCVNKPCAAPGRLHIGKAVSEKDSLREAVEEAAAMLKAARRPLILAGVEVHRFGVQDSLLKLVERSGYPIAATVLGKSVIGERHPQYVGVYEGAMGREKSRRAVEKSDCVLILGAFMTDLNLGIYTAQLEPGRTVYAHSKTVEVKHHHYDGIYLGHFIDALAAADLGAARKVRPARVAGPKPFRPHPKEPVTVKRFFQRMDSFLADDTIVICDTGDCMFGGADLTIHRHTEFLGPAYYTSMGFAVPAAVGAQIRNPRLRPLVLVGDGAFQMTGQEVSTITRYKLDPIIIVLNNRGFTTERFIHEGPYNDVHEWAYHLMTQVVQSGWGCEVHTEGELEDALAKARANTGSLSLINLHLDPMDCSPALTRLGERLGKRIK